MKVLYLEDNALDAELVRIELGKRAPEIQLDIVSTFTEALARLEKFYTFYGNSQKRMGATAPISNAGADFHCELVLTDLNLPDGSGKTLLAQVRSWHLPLPVVVLTGSGSEELLLALLRAGADDYVIKHGGYLETLPLVLLATLEKFHNETFRRAAPLRVVFVDPNTRDVDLTKRELVALAPHLNVESLQTREQVFDRFTAGGAHNDIDVLLLDYRLPGASATDILKELCQVRGLDVPIVLVIEQGDEEMMQL